MLLSPDLLEKAYTSVLFNAASFFVLLGFSLYIYFSAKRTPLFFCYMALLSSIMVWLLAKVFKTFAMSVEARWILVLIQYIGVESLFLFYILFCYLYTRDRLPRKKTILWLAVMPTVSYITLLLDPLFRVFFAQFGYEAATRKFVEVHGALFFMLQAYIYAYWIAGTVILWRASANPSKTAKKRNLAKLFALITLLPLVANLYYLIADEKNGLWIFPFPRFDITPVAAGLSLSLFMAPALKNRLFDISPFSYSRLFKEIHYGIVFINSNDRLYGGNEAFYAMFTSAAAGITLTEFSHHLAFDHAEHRGSLLDFVNGAAGENVFEALLGQGVTYRITKSHLQNRHTLLCFTDVSILAKNQRELMSQREKLDAANQELAGVAQLSKELVLAKTKNFIAQNMHDILGHSLTVAIGTAELITMDTELASVRQKVAQMHVLLTNSLTDLKKAILGEPLTWEQTALIQRISQLNNQNIQVDFELIGTPYELDVRQTEAVFYLCQEAVTNAITHGKAKTIHLLVRYRPNDVEVFAIDDGAGCLVISKNLGLSGIEMRIQSLGGRVSFDSDGEQGFHIRASIPVR